MIALSAQQQKVFASDSRANHLRVSVKDSGGTWRDLSTYAGPNMVVSASWSVSLDQIMWTLNASIAREVDGLSLAPDVQASPLNRAFAFPGTYAELIAVGREILVEVTFLPVDVQPQSSDWMPAFQGYIDVADAGSNPITLQARDLGGRLQDKQIEVERAYGFAPVFAGLRVFSTNTAYALNEYVIPTTGKLTGHYYRVTTAGTTGTAEPTWSTGGGSTTTSGTVTFTEQGATTDAGQPLEWVVQGILNDNPPASGAPTLSVPVSPGMMILPYNQQRGSVLEAVQTVTEQRGWDVRYKWTAGVSLLTLYAPNRAATVPDQTFTASQYAGMPRVERDIRDVRNAVTVYYSDSADLDTGKVPKRKSMPVSDAASIAKYGRRYMEVAEEAASHIDTVADATNFANAMLSDLKEPLLGIDAELPLYPFAELADLYRFGANGRSFDVDQDLAVVAISHSMDSSGKARTKITASGKPAVGRDRWHDYEAAPDTLPGHDKALFNRAPLVITTAPTISGTRVTVGSTRDKHTRWSGMELHIGSSAGFVPDASTLKSKGIQQEAVITDLTPGATYYAKAIPYGMNDSRIVRAEPTEATSFVAGYVEPAHADPDANMLPMPPNGDFGGRLLAVADFPPDRWNVETGAWKAGGADIYEATGVEIRSGVRSILFGTAVTAQTLLSDYLPVIPDQVYAVEMWARASNVAQTPKLEVEWHSAKGTLISTSTLSRTPAGTTFYLSAFNVQSPSAAKFAKVRIGKTTASANTVTVDDVRMRPVGDKWHAVGAAGEPAFQGTAPNDWQNFGAPHDSTAFMRDSLGFVHVRGAVKTSGGGSGNPPVGATIFTLPVGYRPAAKKSIPVIAGGNVLGRLNIDSGGVVSLEPGMGNSTGIVIPDITFMADL